MREFFISTHGRAFAFFAGAALSAAAGALDANVKRDKTTEANRALKMARSLACFLSGALLLASFEFWALRLFSLLLFSYGSVYFAHFCKARGWGGPFSAFCAGLFSPAARLMESGVRREKEKAKGEFEEDDPAEEIREIVDAEAQTGAIDESEIEMITNIFDFDDKTAEDIATHRTDIVALPADAGAEEITRVLVEGKFSRVPVYEESIDNIKGILYVRDLVNLLLSGGDARDIKLNKIMRKPYFVPGSKKTDELFRQMQADRLHIAVVIDEYGGTTGLVTMEDLVEEVMGSILDEFDEEERPQIESIDEERRLVEGTTPLPEVEDFFGVELKSEEYDTLGGFVIGQLGHIPEDGERPEIKFAGLSFTVQEMEGKRIKFIEVRKSDEKNETE